MVHALHEACRVLKPGGYLLDLRPAPKHRRLGVGTGRNWQLVGVMREKFDDDYASNRAVSQVLREGLFQKTSQTEFDLDRVMDTVEDFQLWLQDFTELGRISAYDWLVSRLKKALESAGNRRKITVRGPLMIGVLKKLEV